MLLTNCERKETEIGHNCTDYIAKEVYLNGSGSSFSAYSWCTTLYASTTR